MSSRDHALIRRHLIDWYQNNHRALPWRDTRDPYPIWVSEIMLQQTRVATVIDYYRRWMTQYPTIEALAEADETDVLKSWEGLGYYSRARNLQAAAQMVVREHGGQLPANAKLLRELPGIGSYTAGAVASIAFNQPEPAIDGNVNRVITRLFCLAGDPMRLPLRSTITNVVQSLLTAENARVFNQALMELGASHCSPTSPSCWQCPLQKQCKAFATDRVSQLPETAARRPLIKERHALGIVTRRGKILTLQTPAKSARWANLWVFPSLPVQPKLEAGPVLQHWLLEELGLATVIAAPLPSLKYHVTRFEIELDIFQVETTGGRTRSANGYQIGWQTPQALRELAMPAPHRKIEKRFR